MGVSTSNARQNIIDTCKIALGYPVVSLFVTDEQINKIIDFSVRRCSSKACPVFTATAFAGQGVVDVSALDIDTVKNIYCSDLNGASCTACGNGCDICEKLCNYRMYGEMTKGDWNNQMYDRLAYQYSRAEIQKETLYDYYLDGTSLYLDNYTGLITIEYIKKNILLEDLDSFWTSWVEIILLL